MVPENVAVFANVAAPVCVDVPVIDTFPENAPLVPEKDPPTFKFFDSPKPPLTTNAPFVVEEESFVVFIVKIPVAPSDIHVVPALIVVKLNGAAEFPELVNPD